MDIKTKLEQAKKQGIKKLMWTPEEWKELQEHYKFPTMPDSGFLYDGFHHYKKEE